MNFEKYTKKSLSAVQRAQSLSIENGNQQIYPEHLALAVLEDDAGLAVSVLKKCGVNWQALKQEIERLVSALPKVSGSGREPDKVYVSTSTDKILLAAEKEAERMKDEYVSVEHLLLAIASESENPLKAAFIAQKAAAIKLRLYFYFTQYSS